MKRNFIIIVCLVLVSVAINVSAIGNPGPDPESYTELMFDKGTYQQAMDWLSSLTELDFCKNLCEEFCQDSWQIVPVVSLSPKDLKPRWQEKEQVQPYYSKDVYSIPSTPFPNQSYSYSDMLDDERVMGLDSEEEAFFCK